MCTANMCTANMCTVPDVVIIVEKDAVNHTITKWKEYIINCRVYSNYMHVIAERTIYIYSQTDGSAVLRTHSSSPIYGCHKDGVTGSRDIDLLDIETW